MLVAKHSYKKVDKELFEKIKIQIGQDGFITLNLSGRSMEPVLFDGDQACLEQVDDLTSLKRFDVVVFWGEDRLFCHYLWHINRHFITDTSSMVFQTRPLNPLKSYDWPVVGHQILGKVRFASIPFILKAKILLQTFVNLT